MKKIMTRFAAAAFAVFGLTAAAETAKLSFIIEGAGKVQVDGDIVHHTQAGDEPRDYAMVTPNADHELIAIPELNGGDEFYAWFSNTLEGTTVDQVIADPTKGKWINISCDTNTTFRMPAGDCVLKAVFKDSPIARGNLTVKVEPLNEAITNDGVVTGIRLDGWDLVADETGAFVTNGVKYGADHALTASLSNANWKVRWFVNDTELTPNANPFAAFDFNAADVTVVAKYESLATGISGSDANETYDKDTECKITVIPGTLIEGTSVVKYSETDSFDLSADTTNPGYTSVDGSPYTVYWRVEDEDGFIHAIGSNTVTINKKDIDPSDVDVTLESGPFVYKREAWEPAVTAVTVTDGEELTLSSPGDYSVTFADNTNASAVAKAIITFVNYSVTGGDGTYVKLFTIDQKPITPTMVAFYTAGQTFAAAEGPFAVVKDGSVELDGPHQYGGAAGTEYKVGYAQVDGAEWKVTVTGLGNYTDSQSATFYRYGDVITKGNVNYTPDPGHTDDDGVIPVEVTSVPATPALTEIVIPATFTEDEKNYKVVAVCSGAFLNQKATLAKITIEGADTELRGNVIKGLERLQEMVLPSDYKYLKYGLTPNNGASILLKKGTDFSDACLLGVAGAGDRFSLTNEVTAAAGIGIASIAKTAFEGNPLLKEAALNNGVTFIAPAARDPRYTDEPLPEPGITETLDLSYTVFTCPEKPSEAITNYFGRYNIGWYPVGDGTWATFDWNLAEAKIVMDGFERGYTNFLDAVKAAREGETVVVLKDVDATGLTVDGKKVILDATGHKVTKLAYAARPNEGDYGIMGVGGTFDANLSDKLVYPDDQALVVNGDGTWTVFAVEGLAARLVDAPLQSYTNLEQAVADPDVAAVILREPAVLFRTIQSAVAAANDGETVVLTKDGGDAVVADAVRTNTIDIAGRNWTAGSLYVKGAGAAVTLKDGAMAKRVRVAKATLTLTNVTALAGFEFYAPSGSLIVESGDYTAAQNAVDGGVEMIAGILVRGGTFSIDYRMKGKFDDQGGTKAFAQIGPTLWSVVDETSIVATNAVSGQVYTNVSMAATCAAPGNVIELIRPSVGETVLLTDEDILKNLKFSDPNDYIDACTPAIGAARHNEYYEIHHNADGTWSLVRKDLPTHRLTFEIEGKGRAWFWNEVANKWQDSRHVQSGTQATVDYTEFAPGLVRLKGVAETDAGDAFWRWEDADGNRLYCEDYAVDPYANEIVFCMPDEAVTLRLVFRPASEVTTSATVTIADALPQADCVQSVWLDKADNTGVEFTDVKNGDHTVGATPADANWRVAAWATNGVIAVSEALYTNLIVTAEDISVTPILVPSTFGVETNDVEITYNGQPTNIEVVVTNGLAAGEYRIEYSLDGAAWSADLAFTNVCNETVLWRVIYLSCDGVDIPAGAVLASGENTLTINPKSLEDTDGSIEFVFDHYVLEQETAPGSGVYVQLTPDVEVIYHTEAGDIVLIGDDDDETADYYLDYGTNKKFGQKGKIIVDAWGDVADGNYTGEVNLEFTILGKYSKDGVTYYLDKNGGGGNERAAVALAKEGGADENGVYTVPSSVTFSTTTYKIVDIVPGAFTNNPDIVTLDLSACTDLDLWGNIIMGLENLEMIDFPGATPADSRYYYARLGEDHNGAGILLKNMDGTAPYDWDDPKAELLGVTAAGDEFTVPDIVVEIAETAFAGNPILKRIVLHNGVTNIVQGFTDYLDLKKTVFTMAEEPSEAIKAIFLNEGEDGIEWFVSPDGTSWTTSPWGDAAAKIVTPLGEETYYATLQEAIDDARDGETVKVLKDLDGGAIVIGAGKKVLIDADGKTLTHLSINPPSVDSLGITAGTFDWDYEHPVNYLVASGHFADPVMSKWYDADADAWRWTVINRPDAVCTVTHGDVTYFCASLADASRSAEAGDTVAVVAAKVEEDVVFDKSLNFVFAKETTWNGKLTATGAGTVVTVSGFRANTPGKRTFAVAGAAAVNFDYSPAQHAVADPSNYAIFRTGESLWRLMSAGLQVAKDTEDDDELFSNMNLAAKLAESGKITVTKTNDQDITAANDFEIVTATDVVYKGWIFNDEGHSVKTALGSVFSQNLIDQFDWSNGLTLAYSVVDDVYTVVEAETIVAQFTFANGMRRVCFTDPATAVAALKAGTFNPIAEFQIGLNDTSLTYDFDGAVKKDGATATFKDLVVFGTGTNTIENAVLRGTAAVTAPRGGDAAGTVIFGQGVRMDKDHTKFTDGDVTLIVKKGAYVNDPSEFCEEGTFGAQRAKPDLTGMFVIYPEAEIAVIAGGARYHTLQDAFDLAASGATITLFNDILEGRYTVPAGKSFSLTTDTATYPDADTVGNVTIKVDGSLRVENIVFDNSQLNAARNMGAVLTVGNGVRMTNRPGGAIVMTTGNSLVIDTTETYIYDNVKADGSQQNVVLEDASILVLNKTDFIGKVGLYMCNFVDGTKFDGEPFGKVTAGAGIAYPDGDITCPEIRFVNDRDPAMTTGMGRQLAQVEGERFTRWVNGFDAVQAEGQWLLSRTGNRLVWLEVPKKPTDAEHELDENAADFVGRTAYTVTIRPKLDDAYGRDYAVVLGSPAATNWVSMTDATAADTLAWNGNDRTFTFENLEKNSRYTVLTRRSISPLNTVSPIRVLGWIRTAKYDAMEIAKMFYEDVTETLPKDKTLAETAGNAAFVTVTTAGNAGNGYVVTLQRDLNRGADLKDDMGRILLQMNGQYLNAKGTDEGITFTAAANYNENLRTDFTVVNNSLNRPGKIVGAIGADGTNGDANGQDGQIGIHNTSANLVKVALYGGVEVYGGQGGKGADRTDGSAGNGGKGGDAIVGNIALEIDGAQLVAGNGGNGGKSTNGTGGNGGQGGNGVGEGVTVNMTSGGIYGGNGGSAGGGKLGAGTGGTGGDGFVDLEKAILQGGNFFGDLVVAPGKGGTSVDPARTGVDGKGGRPQAPEKATVKYVTGESVTFNVEPNCEYLVFKTADGEPSVEQETWIATGAQQTDLYVAQDTFGNPLVKGTGYTVWARKPAKDGNLISFYAANVFWTRICDADTIAAAFKGKATVAETAAHDGYVITLTDDIDETVEIPDNWGKLALEMGSFSIRGRDGVKDTAFAAQDAIVFTAAGDRPELTTTLTINGDGANEIRGGDGATHSNALANENGFDGGNGGFGLGTRVGWYGVPVKHIFVTLVKGTLRGGEGGKGADTVDGRAGNGGNGGDAYDAGNITVVIKDPQVSGGEGGGVYGGNGGKGGNVYGGVAGNGGDGGSAIGGEGGWAGRGGQTLDQTGTAGTDGNGGFGVIPGSVSADYLVKLVHMTGAEDFYESFEEAIAAAIENDTLVVIRGNKKMPDGTIDYKTCVFDGDDYGELVVGANNVRITTDNARGVALEWNGTVRVDSGVTGFTIDAACNISEDSTGELILDGAARIDGGFIPDLKVYFEGSAFVTGGTIGEVLVEQGGKFTVELESDAVVTGAITCDDSKDVLLLGGLYEKDPSQFRRDPFMVKEPKDVDGTHYKIVQDPKFAAMASTDGGLTWKGVETVDAAFAEIARARGPILVYLLKDETTVTTVLSDQAYTDAVIMGPAHKGRTIVDGRTGIQSEDALFTLQGNLTLQNVTFDGRGQTGKFIELMGSKTVTLDNCKVTGYKCSNPVDGKIQLISASSAGAGVQLVLNDTELTGNDVSCAISTEDRSGSRFTYPVYVSGRTTITDNVGKGIVSTGYGQIVMAGPLTGGWIDVAYDGYGARQYFATTVAGFVYAGVENFRYDGSDPLVEKTCGAFAYNVTTGKLELDAKGRILIKWGEDERQWAAKVTYAGGAYRLFETVEEALQNVENGATLKLENDATVRRSVTVRLDDSNESFTLDLNGKTLTNSANKLKFGTGIVTIENGTLACESAYALYLYGATVELRNVTVDHDIYVARGFLQVKDNANVGVRGVIAKTNVGTISLSSGLYTENPSPYTASNRAAAQVTVGDYLWEVVDATEVVGFANGFVIDTTPDANGKVNINLTNHEAFGNLRDGAKIVFTGDVRENVTVAVPDGWKAVKTYDYANGKTVVTLRMDETFLMPELGSDDPGERPLEFVTQAGGVVHVTMRVKNGVKGFWYQLQAKDDLNPATPWVTVAETQATENGNLTIELNTTKDRFFKVNVSDHSYKGN